MSDERAQMLAELEGGSSEAASPEAPAAEAAPESYEFQLGDQTVKIPLTHEMPIKHNGQMVNAQFGKMLTAYRERANLQDNYAKLKAERDAFNQERDSFGEFQGLHDKYGAIQKWSEENPQEWARLWEIYENKDKHLLGSQVSEGQEALLNEIVALKQQITDLSQFKSTFEKKQEEEAIQKDVAKINTEIEEFQSTYGEKYGIDLAAANEEGVTLKAEIIQHGIDNGYPDFKSSALSYLAPRLLEAAESSGRKLTAKEVQENNKQGILNRQPTKPANVDPLRMSDEEVKDAALAEFVQMTGG